MGQLKKLLLLSSIPFVVACAAKWDNADYSRVIDIRHTVSVAQRENACANVKTAQTVADAIERDAHWLLLYSDYLPNNGPGQEMALGLFNTAAEFSKHYETATTPRSEEHTSELQSH